MATTEFKLPELGENIDAGEVVSVAVKPGEAVREGQTVVELETDKAVVEVPSTVNGVVEQVQVKKAQKVKVGEVLFTYKPGDAKEQPQAAAAEKPKAEKAAAKESKPAAAKAESPAAKAPDEDQSAGQEAAAQEKAAQEKPKEKAAEEKGAKEKPQANAPSAAPPAAESGGEVKQKPSGEQAPPKAKTEAAPQPAQQIEIKLPELGENIHSGDVVRVSVQPGEQVSEGQTVLEVETDKAVVEVPSSAGGTVGEVKVKVGQQLKVGDTILTLSAASAAPADGGKAPAAPKAEAAPKKSAPESAAQAEAEPEAPAEAPGEAESEASAESKAPAAAAAQPQAEPEDHSDEGYMEMARHSFYSARTAEGKEEAQALPPDAAPEAELRGRPRGAAPQGDEHRTVAAAPIVRKLAREIGVDISQVHGTGPGGRIGEDDVKAYAKSAMAQAAAPPEGGPPLREPAKLPDFGRWGKVERVPMRAVRRKTAEHLALAWNAVAHVTQFDKADVTELEELRQRFSPKAEKAGGKMTMTAIALKVVSSALKAFPQFNSSLDMASQEIVYKRYTHIGVAVDTERGLLVPVIRDVDKKNIIDLAVELAALSKKAHDKKLTPEEMEGGTFTITNLGGVGGTAFTPIVNYPEVAILGISRTHIEPVWIDNAFEPRSMLPLSLSYDHRMIDGADAARFLRWVVDALEQPFLLSVQG